MVKIEHNTYPKNKTQSEISTAVYIFMRLNCYSSVLQNLFNLIFYGCDPWTITNNYTYTRVLLFH
jgi:hypothetical protein